MIHFITQQSSLYSYPDIALSTIQNLLDYCKDKKVLGVDTETTGFDPHTDRLLMLQIGDEHRQYVIDATTVDVRLLKDLLEDESKIFIMHNAKFDLRFLFKAGIRMQTNVYCSFLAERVLSCGIDSHLKSLQACVERYLKLTLSKEERGLIHKLGIYDSKIIKYAAKDVEYLGRIRDYQLQKAQELEVTNTIELENLFVPVLAYIEYCGFKLDQVAWAKKSEEEIPLLHDLERELNQMVVELGNPKFLAPPDLFNTEPSCVIQWSSGKQVAPLFKSLGLNLLVINDKGKEVDSVEKKVIEPQKDLHPIVGKFLEYQAMAKKVSTYGHNFLKHVNETTGRIHTNFTQIINSGRISSGKEDDKNPKPGEVNMQNIPSGKERSCFVPERGNNFVVADYSGQETQILNYYAKDPKYTEYVSQPDKDLHSFMARLIDMAKYGDQSEMRALSDMEIKDQYKQERTDAKPGTFCIPYGGSGFTIAENCGLTPEQGEWIYEEYMKYFSGLKKYFEKVKEKSLRQGYVLINPMTGRKWFYPNRDMLRGLTMRLESFSTGMPGKDFQGLSAGFWEYYRRHKALDDNKFREVKKILADYFKVRGGMERVGLNAPIQGTGADMTKLAGVRMFDWIMKNNLFGVVKICLTLHDEYVLECPEDISEQVAPVLKESMESAAKVFCPTVPIVAKPVVSKAWDH